MTSRFLGIPHKYVVSGCAG